MSDVGTTIRASALTALDDLGGQLAQEFTSGLSAILEGAPAAARGKVESLIRDGFHFKKMSLQADTQEDAREYAEAAEKVKRRVKTVLIAESIVAEDSTASLVSDLFGKALDGLGAIAKGLVTTIVAGLVKGVASGIMGEDGAGLDPSSIFPFA